MKILICGATGFIGRNLLENLSKNKDNEITGVFFDTPAPKLNSINFIRADLRIYEQVQSLVVNYDVVLQYAAKVSNILNDPQMIDNVLITLNLIKASVESKVKHFIFPSCGYLYNNGETPFREKDIDYSNLPENYFAATWSKVYCEKMCQYFSSKSNTKFTVIRQANIYGRYDKLDINHAHALSSLIIKTIKATENLEVWGDGNQKKDILHVEDLCNFIDLVIHNKKNQFDLINIGSGEFVTMTEIAEKIIKASNKHLKINYNSSKPSSNVRWRLDYSLAEKEFYWHPKIKISDGIQQTYDWYSGQISDN